MRFKRTICSLLTAVWMLTGCSNETDPVQNSMNSENHYDCTEMTEQDKGVMRFLRFSFTYSQNPKDYAKALALSKHACTLPHNLPDVFYNTALLFQLEGDTANARIYLRKEIIQDIRILLSPEFPECKKDRFRKCLYETCAALNKYTDFILFDDFFKRLPYSYGRFFPGIIGK